MMLEILSLFTANIFPPSSPRSTAPSFLNRLNGSPGLITLHSLNRKIILDELPPEIRDPLLRDMEARNLTIAAPVHHPQPVAAPQFPRFEEMVQEPHAADSAGRAQVSFSQEGPHPVRNEPWQGSSRLGREGGNRGRHSYGAAFVQGITGTPVGEQGTCKGSTAKFRGKSHWSYGGRKSEVYLSYQYYYKPMGGA